MIIAGTGSRSFVLTDEIKATYLKTIIEVSKDCDSKEDMFFMSGMAEGWDEFVARTAIELGCPFIAVVPNKGYGNYYWYSARTQSGNDRRQEFNDLLDKAQEVIYVCHNLYENGVHANFIRNQYMVDHADHFLVWHAPSRGKDDTMRRIEAAGKPYSIIGS